MRYHIDIFAAWPYLIIAFLFLFLIQEKPGKKDNGFWAFIIIYCFAIFRYNIGNDYRSYWDSVSGFGNDRQIELLSGAIINFVRSVHFPPLLFIIFATIHLLCYKIVINKYSNNPSLSWYFYFTFPILFFQDCSTLRQAGAMGFFFLSYYFLDNKKYLFGIICLITAVLFHNSAVVCFLLLLLPLYHFVGRWGNIILFIASFFLGQLAAIYLPPYLLGFDSVYATRFEWYMNFGFEGAHSLQYVMYAFVILNLIFYNQLCQLNEKNKLYITLVCVGICLYNLFSFESQTAMRFFAFFFLFEILIIPSYKPIIYNYVKNSFAAYSVIWLLMLGLQMTLIVIYINAYNKGVLDSAVYVPYRFWFNHI